MSIDDIVWGDALRITGARAVIVTAIETRKPLRSATLESLPDRDSIAAMAAAIAETAAELVRLTDAGTTMDDLLVTSPGWFHVLQVVESEGSAGYVAHLLLQRREANLAMARREFRDLVRGAMPVPVLVPSAAGPYTRVQEAPEPEETEPPAAEPVPAAVAAAPTGGLPRRTPSNTGPWDRGPAHEESAPSWFAKFAGQPFEADGWTVERVRDGLHRLA